jgi:peptide/nickel transport system substrate-binding protein
MATQWQLPTPLSKHNEGNKMSVMRSLSLGLACLIGAVSPSLSQTLTIALKADIRGHNPGVNRDDDTDAVTLHMVEGLVGYREGGSVGPMLAEKIEKSEDGRIYTFELRKGLKFHNGAPMTAQDVVWSWNRYMDPKTDWRCLSEFDGRNGLKVEAIEATSPSTVKMRINAPNALFLFNLARTDCGSAAVIHRDSVAPDGSWKAPIGTGPFKFSEWQRGQHVLLTRFDDYQSLPGGLDGFVGGKRPLVPEVKFMVVPDASTVKAGLLVGQLDVAEVLGTDLEELKGDPRVAVQTVTTAARHALLFQTNDPVFNKPAMRRAIAAAIDLQQLVASVSELDAKPNASTIHPSSTYFSDAHKLTHKHDVALAKQLLTEAGYKGERLKISTNNRKSAPSFNIAIVIQAMLQAAGINSDIEVVEWSTHMDRFLKGNYQMMVHSYSARLDPALSYEHFTGTKAEQPRKVWDNQEVIKLLTRASQIDDEAERKQIFDQLHTQMIGEVPLVMLFNNVEAWANNTRVSGFKPWESRARAWEVSIK